jgi:hypothetical protein
LPGSAQSVLFQPTQITSARAGAPSKSNAIIAPLIASSLRNFGLIFTALAYVGYVGCMGWIDKPRLSSAIDEAEQNRAQAE